MAQLFSDSIHSSRFLAAFLGSQSPLGLSPGVMFDFRKGAIKFPQSEGSDPIHVE
jgi:hypothetical protein